MGENRETEFYTNANNLAELSSFSSFEKSAEIIFAS